MSHERRIILWLSAGLLLAALVAVAVAPLLLGPDYDPVRRSISESAAQQTAGAWLGRLGLFLSGLGVLGVTLLRASAWRAVPTVAIALFGTFWMLTAVFSTASWRPGTAIDSSESTVHSMLASAMAVIVVGTLVIGLRRSRDDYPTPTWRTATLLFAVAATVLPLGAAVFPEIGGILQRLMFLIAYLWFLGELFVEVRAYRVRA